MVRGLVTRMLGPTTDVEDLVQDAYDDTPAHLWPIALLSLRSHLDKLADEGRATQQAELWQAVAEA